MMKSIIATMVAMFAAVIIVLLVESISHQMYPAPSGFDFNNKQALADWIKTLPIGALLMVISGWFLAAVVGGFVACYLDKENPMRRCLVFGAVLLGTTMMNLFQIPHPAWMWAGGIIAIGVGAWIGYKLFSLTFVNVKAE